MPKPPQLDMVPDELAGFIESGIAIHIATRDDRLDSNGMRVWAVAVDRDRRHVTAYIHAPSAKRVLADLRANGQASLGFGRPTDHRACQIKGVFTGARPASPAEKAIVKRQSEGCARAMDAIGIPMAAIRRFKTRPCVAVTIRVTELFSQTPGPGAGERLK